MKSEINSKKSEELIIKENDFLGFKRIKTDKIIENYEKAFRSYRATILKNKSELKFRSEQITELNTKVDDLKKSKYIFSKTKTLYY